MKHLIGYIEFENQPKIGDLSLNFYKNENQAYNTIILAGENGCGKTAILEAIADFQRGAYLKEWSSIKKVEYIDPNNTPRTILRTEESKRYAKPEEALEEWGDIWDFSEQDFYRERFELADETPYDIRNRRLVFSEARSGFEVKIDDNVRRSEYDDEKYEKEGSNYSGIVKLLIDLEEDDDKDYIRQVKINPDYTYAEYKDCNSRIARFRKTFEDIFKKKLSYKGKAINSDGQTVCFVKGEQEIDINELSAGEKQIVLRGTDLLFHATVGATVLIDEPELSLHPKWQKEILKFYRSLFTDEKGRQIAQIIIATHSQYVVQSAMTDNDNIKIIVLERDDSVVKANTIESTILGPHVSAEVNYLAFGVEEISYHIQLFATLHNKLQNIPESGVDKRIASIDNFIRTHALYDSSKHEREDASHGHYHTLPVYIRNAIDHPDGGRTYSEEDMEKSIKLLRAILQDVEKLETV